MFILELSKEHPLLAKKEVELLLKIPFIKYKNYLLLKELPSIQIYQRLTLTQTIFKLTPYPKRTQLSVERHGVALDSKEFKNTISELKHNENTINLSKPDKIFALLKFKKEIFFTEKIWVNPKTFLTRHPKDRPGFHPGACVPKFARVLVNLSGIHTGKILDPFCGTGGILIEANDCGLDSYGSDISNEMIHKAKANLIFYSMKPQIIFHDALTITGTYDAIITEVPFGKTTLLDRSVSTLVSEFLKNAKLTTKKIVISVPTGYRYSFRGWRKTFDTSWYIHKSLSKRIIVLAQV